MVAYAVDRREYPGLADMRDTQDKGEGGATEFCGHKVLLSFRPPSKSPYLCIYFPSANFVIVGFWVLGVRVLLCSPGWP